MRVACSPLQQVSSVQQSLFTFALPDNQPEILGYLKEIYERQKQLVEQQQQTQERLDTLIAVLSRWVTWIAKHASPFYMYFLCHSSYSNSTSSTSTDAACLRTSQMSYFNYSRGQFRRGTFLFTCFAICSCPVNLQSAMLGESGASFP